MTNRFAATAVACAVTIASVLVAQTPSASAAPTAAAAPTQDPIDAPDAATAMRLAWKFSKPIEVLGERTESSQTFAQPDGTFRTKQFATPVRVRQGSQWVDVDPALESSGAGVVPNATAWDVRC